MTNYNASNKIDTIQNKLNRNWNKLDYCETMKNHNGFLVALDEEQAMIICDDTTTNIVIVCDWDQRFLTITPSAAVFFTEAEYEDIRFNMIKDLVVNQNEECNISAYGPFGIIKGYF